MEAMLEVRRTALRREVDVHLQRLQDAIQAEDRGEAAANMSILREQFTALQNVDTEIQIEMSQRENKPSQDEILEEYSTAERYRSKFFGGRRLPKIDLKEFDGDVRNWLGFWSQFRSVDEDSELSPIDKFSYLSQAMVPGSPAAELVNRYIPSEASSPKVIQHLKSRFARDGLLIETYMRELLALVMQNYSGKGLELRVLYDRLVTQLRALEALGISSNKYAAMLKPLVESALPDDVLQAWQRSRVNIPARGDDANREGEELEALLEFLSREVEGEQQRRMAKEAFGGVGMKDTPYTAASLHASDRRKNETKTGLTSVDRADKKDAVKGTCVWCERGSHSAAECFKPRSWSRQERVDWLQKKNACFTCLRVGHRSADCKATVRCLVCPGKHYTVMCARLAPRAPKDTPKSNTSAANSSIPVEQPQSPSAANSDGGTVLLSSEAGPTLLQTLQAKIMHQGSERIVRVLLDSGSQRSYVTKKVALGLRLESLGKESLSHSLFGGTETRVKVHNKYRVVLQGLNKPSTFKFSALDEEQICNHVPRLMDTQVIQRLARANIVLSDVGPNPPPVDVLLGADVLGGLTTGLTMDLGNQLVAIETILGWTVMGPTRTHKAQSSVIGLANLNFELQDMWQLEVLGIRDADARDKEKVRKAEMERLLDIHVNDEGRYEVALPWKGRTPVLMCNRQAAETRLRSTTRKLVHSSKFSEYGKVFGEWLELGIIERVPENEDKNEGFYLPHRAVIKESSETTKIRPVFDASARDYNGVSLNSGLEKGPNLIEDILKLLIQFRRGAIGVTADIAKAFLQISILPEHRKYLKFLWWDEGRKKMIEYRHKRVVFGVTSSPFLLNATIEHHLGKAPDEFGEVARKLQGTFYMDNVVTSVEDRQELLQFVSQAKALMELGKFDLRQWASGPDFIEPVQNPGKPLSILGVHWDRVADELFVNRNPTADPGVVTRRALLSLVHSVFDPLGLICPYTLLPRLMLQEAWDGQGGWDDAMSSELQKKVLSWVRGAGVISNCRMERRLTVEKWTTAEVSLHVFCDASRVAYAACVFIRERGKDMVRVRLVQAKSRVAPRKPHLSVPRLELMAALIGVRLCNGIQAALGTSDLPTFYWSDSRVVLNWVKGGKDWSVFVRNRCAEINKWSRPEQWRHVPGVNNPADLPSRGCSAETLENTKWWEGPDWLRKEEKEWPVGDVQPEEKDKEEIEKEVVRSKANVLVQINQDVQESGVPLRSKFVQILTTVVRMIRWRTKKKGERLAGFTSEEMHDAERRVFQAVQKAYFSGGAKFTKEMETFQDEKGYLRLKTRLTFSEEPDDFKNPILLPGGSRVVQAFVREQHFALKHAGLRTMISKLRERFWITDIRRVVKRVIAGCKACKRQTAKPLETPPAPLPKDRVHLGAVFEVTGIDYAGPLHLRGGEKAWIVLFTCAVYRAVHLEVVTTLSTQGFFQAFQRFMCRRGRPSVVYTDNGTQFRGAARALEGVKWEELITRGDTRPIKWVFIPPAAPWWGGFWERLVGMVKQLLRRNLGRATLTQGELGTMLCDIEAIINSRPLTGNSIDEPPITPARFLHSLPPAGVDDLDQAVRVSLSSRLKYMLKLREGLKERFKNEYLALLVNRQKRQPRDTMIRPGDVVLVAAESRARVEWPLGLVLEVKPGKDGHGRVARLKIAGGRLIERPVRRLYPFEVMEEMPKPEEVPELQPWKPVEDLPKKGEEVAVSGMALRSGRKLKP